jgi:hypothetical protein
MNTATFVSKEQAEHDRARRDWNARVEMGLADCFRAFPEIVPSMASRQLIVDWCDQFMGQACIPSAVILKAARDQNRQAFKEDFASVSASVESQRAEIIARILVLLAAGGRMTEADLANERARLQRGFTRDALLRREQYIQTAQRLARMSVPQLKQERAEMRGDNLPPLIVLLPEEWTAQELKRLTNTDLPKFKRLQAEYGDKQINDRLAGRS